MMIYRKNFTLTSDIVCFDLNATNGWTPDCQGKQDYDPDFVRGSSRIWPDGQYCCSIVIGSDVIIDTGILTAANVHEAKMACETWMENRGDIIRAAVMAALGNPAR